MVQLAILLTKNYRLLSVAAILDLFETVNQERTKNDEQPYFQLNLLYSGAYSNEVVPFEKYHPKPLKEAGKQDLILVPAFDTKDLRASVNSNMAFLPFLNDQYHQGAEVGSFCTGAFLLAASGLLDGKTATTHIHCAQAFSDAFPHVILKEDAVVTHEERLYTSGGATSSFHLMLQLIQRYCGKEVAVKMAKVFAIDMNREQQRYFGTFSPLQDHGDDLVTKTQRCIENAYSDPGTIEQILHDIPASRRNIVRRFKLATGTTLIEYLQKTRVEAAKKMLEQTNKSIMEIMLDTGYNDLKTFRQLFKKSSGMTPKEYRDKFKLRVVQEEKVA